MNRDEKPRNPIQHYGERRNNHETKFRIPLAPGSARRSLLRSGPGHDRPRRRRDSAPVTYYSTYGSLEEVRAASAEINRQIGEESVVPMKNQNNVLPLQGVRFVSVFGKAAEDPFYAGGGSGTAAGYYPEEMYTSIYDSLEAAGYSVNPSLRAFYEKQVDAGALEGDSFSCQVANGEVTFSGNRAQISDTDPAAFTGAVLDSYARYSDAAIIVLGRTGSEGGDKDMGRTREAFIAEELNKAGEEADKEALKAALENARTPIPPLKPPPCATACS